MSILPKAIYRFNAIPIKLPLVFFRELEQIISQFVWKYKKPQMAKAILRKRIELEESTTWLQSLLQSHSHQDSVVLSQRQKYRWHKLESPEIHPSTYGHLIFDRGGKNVQRRKDSPFSMWYWEDWRAIAKEWNHFLYQFSLVAQACPNLCNPMTHSTPGVLSNTKSSSVLKLMSIKLVMPSSHLILCHPLLLLPQSLPASGSFPVSQPFAWGGQSIGVSASASVLPMNTQDLSPLGWTGWISLQSRGLSRVFSNTIAQKHQFFGA